MKIYRLHKQQHLPVSLTEAWQFFSNPANLNEITPNDLSFEIQSGADEPTFAGQVICYRIRPILNIPMNWVTEITHCVEQSYFVDEQRFGPYQFWHHLHRFKADEQGVLMEDILHYALPMGILGELVAGAMVRRKVEGIFTYRFKKLEALFSQEKY